MFLIFNRFSLKRTSTLRFKNNCRNKEYWYGLLTVTLQKALNVLIKIAQRNLFPINELHDLIIKDTLNKKVDNKMYF